MGVEWDCFDCVLNILNLGDGSKIDTVQKQVYIKIFQNGTICTTNIPIGSTDDLHLTNRTEQ